MNQHQHLVKEELMKAYQIDQHINDKVEQIVSLKEMATKTSAGLSDMPGSPNRNIHKTENVIVMFVDMETEVKKELEELIRTKQHTMNLIRQVQDSEGRRVLEERYIHYRKWEEIASTRSYSVRQLFRIHDKALMEIKISET